MELRNDSLKKFDQASEETLMAMKKATDMALLEVLCYGQLEKSALVKNALAPYHSDQVHRKETKCYTKLKAMVPVILTDQQQHSLVAP